MSGTSRASRRWTAADIPDLAGRRAVVTGGNSGLGFRTVLEVARHGATVVLVARDPGRGVEARSAILREAPAASVEVGRLDLADLQSVRAFAGAWDGPLDILVNNAGVMAIPRHTTADGFEMQFGTNHLGHFALTGLLLPALLAAPAARVVTVSSGAHQMGRLDFEDLQNERQYRKWEVYGTSKLANLLFAFELDRRAAAAGVPLVSVAAHPGYAATNLQSVGPRMEGSRVRQAMMAFANRFLAQSDAMGALPQLYAATMADVRGGEYYGPDRWREQRGHPTRVLAKPAAYDPELARLLWEASEELTAVGYVWAR